MTTEQDRPVYDDEAPIDMRHLSAAHDQVLGEILTYLVSRDPDYFDERRRGAAARVQAAYDGRTGRPDADHLIAAEVFRLLNQVLERAGRPYAGAAIIPLPPTNDR